MPTLMSTSAGGRFIPGWFMHDEVFGESTHSHTLTRPVLVRAEANSTDRRFDASVVGTPRSTTLEPRGPLEEGGGGRPPPALIRSLRSPTVTPARCASSSSAGRRNRADENKRGFTIHISICSSCGRLENVIFCSFKALSWIL